VLIYLTSNHCLFQINFVPSVFYYMCFTVCHIFSMALKFLMHFHQQEFLGLVYDVVTRCTVCIIVINMIIIFLFYVLYVVWFTLLVLSLLLFLML